MPEGESAHAPVDSASLTTIRYSSTPVAARGIGAGQISLFSDLGRTAVLRYSGRLGLVVEPINPRCIEAPYPEPDGGGSREEDRGDLQHAPTLAREQDHVRSLAHPAPLPAYHPPQSALLFPCQWPNEDHGKSASYFSGKRTRDGLPLPLWRQSLLKSSHQQSKASRLTWNYVVAILQPQLHAAIQRGAATRRATWRRPPRCQPRKGERPAREPMVAHPSMRRGFSLRRAWSEGWSASYHQRKDCAR